MKLFTLVNTLNILFIFLIIYNIIYKKSIQEGLSGRAKEIDNKIKSIESDIASIRKVNPLIPCFSINSRVEKNTKDVNSMKDTINDLKANCERQNAS